MNEASNIGKDVINALKEGETILYPTDTIWGVGCDATNASAVEKLYQIKQRDREKSMLILMSMALAKKVLPAESCCWKFLLNGNPTTVIFAKEMGTAEVLMQHRLICPSLLSRDGSIGIRIPQHNILQQWLSAFGKPLVSTSANLSGEPSPKNYEDISPRLKERVDYCVPNLEMFASHRTAGSRILKLVAEDEEPIVIR